MTHALTGSSLDPRKVANMAVTEGVNLKYVEVMRRSLYAAAAELDRLNEVADAARDLHERVEMDESVGVCLSDRVPSLRLGAALADLPLANGGTQ